ncbi:hypothetical protein Vadar_009008 [Vaccinium darrowii]|uniref:Uncharacterized protein n=1 Tax=Vaccinium darrowii TaxID=229202 RepID=A0ACB7YUC3_9ERIC|nr:hypothetical protein Vadar_009008 [Vaccinium darrowii]
MEGVGVLKRDAVAVNQRLPVVNEAVVVTEAFEDAGVDETGGAEPAAAEVDAGDVTAGDTDVHDFNRVGWDAVWEGWCRALVNHYV